jgi:hypothetical protein
MDQIVLLVLEGFLRQRNPACELGMSGVQDEKIYHARILMFLWQERRECLFLRVGSLLCP